MLDQEEIVLRLDIGSLHPRQPAGNKFVISLAYDKLGASSTRKAILC